MTTKHDFIGYSYYHNEETGEWTSPYLMKPEASEEAIIAALSFYNQMWLYY